jgi:class 3 adenylate cyclase
MADEILVSAAVADQLGTHVRVIQRNAASLKGIPEAVEVAAVVWARSLLVSQAAIEGVLGGLQVLLWADAGG